MLNLNHLDRARLGVGFPFKYIFEVYIFAAQSRLLPLATRGSSG